MEHILFVDYDLAAQLDLTRILADAGYLVTSVSRGVDALRLLAEHSDRFDVLLTETDLPDDITGVSLASFSRRMRPGRPTVFTSGHAETLACWLHVNEAALQKPVDGQTLLNAVHTVLK